jgi:hypothetical protein
MRQLVAGLGRELKGDSPPHRLLRIYNIMLRHRLAALPPRALPAAPLG